MAEYINRNAVHDLVRSLTKYAWTSPENTGHRVTVDADDVNFGVDKIPSANVAPVRHAKWEECHWVEQDGQYSLVAYPKAAFRCSGCKYVFKKELLWKDNYCPNCGYKMTGIDECFNCKYSDNGEWNDNGICFACREDTWIYGKKQNERILNNET